MPVFVEPEGISEAMDEAMIKLTDKDYIPFYLQGSGHSFAGARAYVKAVTGNILFWHMGGILNLMT